jgi:hypothetical protein
MASTTTPRTTTARKSVIERSPLLAAVGATDLAVERVRTLVADLPAAQAQMEARLEKVQSDVVRVQSDVQKRLAALEPKSLQSAVAQVPSIAVARALEAAGRAEAGYESLAERGKQLIGRLRGQKATQDLLAQGRSTVSRTKAAVTTARKGADDTAASAKGTVTVGRRQASEVAESTEKTVSAGAKRTRSAAKRTATTARRRTAATRSAAKGAATSARKTASAAAEAVESGVEKVGD